LAPIAGTATGQEVTRWFVLLTLRMFWRELLAIAVASAIGYGGVFGGLHVLTRAAHADGPSPPTVVRWLSAWGDVAVVMPLASFVLLLIGFGGIYAANTLSASLSGRGARMLSRAAQARLEPSRVRSDLASGGAEADVQVARLVVHDARDAGVALWRLPQALTSLVSLALATAILFSIHAGATVGFVAVLGAASPLLVRSFRQASLTSREVRSASTQAARLARRHARAWRATLPDDPSTPRAAITDVHLDGLGTALTQRYTFFAQTQLIASMSFAVAAAVLLVTLIPGASTGGVSWGDIVIYLVVAKFAADGLRRAATSIAIAARQFPALQSLHATLAPGLAAAEGSDNGAGVGAGTVKPADTPFTLVPGTVVRVVSNVTLDAANASWYKQRLSAAVDYPRSLDATAASRGAFLIPQDPLRSGTTARAMLRLDPNARFDDLLRALPTPQMRQRLERRLRGLDGHARWSELSRRDRVNLALASGYLRGWRIMVLVSVDYRTLGRMGQQHWLSALGNGAFIVVNHADDALPRLGKGTWIALPEHGPPSRIRQRLNARELATLLGSGSLRRREHGSEDDQDEDDDG